MSTHKYFDVVCCVVVAICVLVTSVFMFSDRFGVAVVHAEAGYEQRLFDTSRVHTIDIEMDDWEGFLAGCTDENYVLCTVIIDGEVFRNVGIRAKGNSSLTQVASYGNNRYSFKIEFDHYDETKSYYGLDKLSLNNIIQDNTYMKDYLSYYMMNQFGVAAPLSSYANITVNGETWGLYLAVESIEESFLERNYGSDYGELYKPDSSNMGGGRGNGAEFDEQKWMEENLGQKDQTSGEESQTEQGNLPDGAFDPTQGGFSEGDFDPTQGGFPGGAFDPTQGGFPGGDFDPTQGGFSEGDFDPAQGGFSKGDFDPAQGGNSSGEDTSEAQTPEIPGGAFNDRTDRNGAGFPGANGNGNGAKNGRDFMKGNDFFNGGMKGMGGTNGSDVSLIYTDDSFESYSNILENAKTKITEADKKRLLQSLKQLNEQSSVEQVVDVEAVIKYFVVHNFVCNFDSYTGSIIHNYYLYEKDGVMSMIPWDYNLAFGSFMGAQSASSLVNYPIDTPVSGGDISSRPMLSWIFSQEEYTELYHQYFRDFTEQVATGAALTEEIQRVADMIAPYVENDPTKFCTYDEFTAGTEALKTFCELRLESIEGQLNGTIPSTQEGQSADSSTLITADYLNINDMGSSGGFEGKNRQLH